MNNRERDSIMIIMLVFIVVMFVLLIELYRKVLSITTFYSTEAIPPEASIGSKFLSSLKQKKS